MVIEFYGGVKKTPGTYFVSEVKNSALPTRLKRFVFSDTQAYILEFGDKYIRFYKDKGAILETAINIAGIDQAEECTISAANSYNNGDEVYISGIVGMTELNGRRFIVSDIAEGSFKIKDIDGNYINSTDFTPWELGGTAARVYTLATNYLSSDIWQLQFAQKEDVLYITHPSYPQAELTRTGHTSWTLIDIDYSVSPAKPGLMPSNITSTTITLTDNAHPSVTLTASAALFDTSDPSLHINSIWKINSAKSVSAPDWELDTAYTTVNYVTFDDEVYFCVTNHTSGSSFAVDLAAGKWSLQNIYVKITAVTDATHATGNILYGSRLEPSPVATKEWSEGAWSKKRGYPKSVTIFESRLVYGYTPSQPQTTWESQTGAYKTFEVGTDDSESTSFKADTNEVEVINWLFPANEILIGTVSGIHTLGTGSDSTAFTPTTVRIKKKSRDGTSSIMPQQIGNNVYYWQKYNRKLREYSYSMDVDNFQTNDATAFSEHISESGIVDMDYQQSPIGVLWCVRADGKLASFTRQIEQKVAGWALHDTDGFYESVAVIPTTSYYDEVWFIVKRVINGVIRRYVEYMTAPEFEEQEDAFFVHSGLTLDNSKAITNITSSKPPIVTSDGSFVDGDIIKIRGVKGMTEVNHKKYKVAGTIEGSKYIKFNIRASRTGSNFKITFHNSNDYLIEHTPDIIEANTWQEEKIDISLIADANKDSINSIITTITNADEENIIYIDNIRYEGMFTIDDMEYSTDALAQEKWVSNAAIANPVSQWKMNDNAANKTVVDAMGNNNGTAQQNTSALTTAGKINSALTFDGSSDYVDCGINAYALGIRRSGTFAGWVKVSSLTSNFTLISDWNAEVGLTLRVNSNRTVTGYVYPNNYRATTIDTVSLDTWAHLTMVMDTTKLKIYINASLKAEVDLPGDVGNSEKTLKIGAFGTLSDYSNGLIDDVRIYNFALTADQVKALYNSGNGTELQNPLLQSYSESTIKTQGSYSLKVIAAITDSLNKTLTRTLDTPLDLSVTSATNFTLQDLDGNDIEGSFFSPYISGGESRKCVNSISGLRHLIGKTVQILADGASHPDRVVLPDGVVLLDDYYSEVHCGLKYTARLVTNDLEPAPGQFQAMGKVKRVVKVWLNIFKSLGCEVGDKERMDFVIFRTSAMPTDEAPAFYTGLKEISFPSGWAKNKKIAIEQNQPLPLHILSLLAEAEIN